MKRIFHVHRIVRESYEIEIDTEAAPSNAQIKSLAENPYSITVLEEQVTIPAGPTAPEVEITD